ncbi:hypothetical protein H632_c609p0 [Helicosporidium sp. ATCC 50920]|nr:hypothetical protein H632_c609p0 [Helicosporidium sp. ATCC 50920]|eukprot:KDD75579.1 hypothetical protein H632_c609p0 [Helicosporidium sp. ATCC 50920]
MVKSVHAMSAAEPGMYATYLRFLAQQAPECPDECRIMDDLIRPSALAALQSAFDPSASGGSPPNHVTMSIVLVDRACELASGSSAPFEVHATTAPVTASRFPACRALVSGGPRKVAVAKDSEWVVARRALEKERNEWDPKAEVLLSTRDGAIIEGLVTNFFVLSRTPRGTVLTTSLPEEGAAWGAVRSRVLEVAQGLGWKVEERSPTMQERREWAEAFITNSA